MEKFFSWHQKNFFFHIENSQLKKFFYKGIFLFTNNSFLAKDLLQKFLTKDIDSRIDVATALKHPWIKVKKRLFSEKLQ